MAQFSEPRSVNAIPAFRNIGPKDHVKGTKWIQHTTSEYPLLARSPITISGPYLGTPRIRPWSDSVSIDDRIKQIAGYEKIFIANIQDVQF